ncbi:MAG: AEC family transporter [Alphaproteobacteria bacterium]
MTAIIDIVLPVFAVILTGYLVAKTRLFTRDGIKVISNFVFFVPMPALLFRTLARGTVDPAADLGIVYAYFLGCFIVFAIGMAVGRIAFSLKTEEQGLLGMGAVFGNTIMLGIPLVYTAFGDPGLVQVMLIVTFHSALLIPLATIVIEVGRGAGGHPFAVAGAALVSLAKNPVIVSMVLGLLWAQLDWTIPGVLDRFLALLGSAGIPSSLFALGATLTTFHLGGDLRQSATLIALKLLLLPVTIWVLTSQVFHLDPLAIAVATVMAALPTGINVFILAERYERYVARSATAVLVSTALAAVTIAVVLGHFAPAPH